MGQRGRLRQRGVDRRRRRADGGTQRTVQGMGRARHLGIALHHQLHAARAGTDQVHAMGVHHRRSNGDADRQRKPHQHEAGELDGVAQGLHENNSSARF